MMIMPTHSPNNGNFPVPAKSVGSGDSQPGSTGKSRNTKTDQLNRTQGKYETGPLEVADKKAESNSFSPQGVEIDRYLKTISRLENRVKKGAIEERETKKLFRALEAKISSMTERKRKQLLKMDFMEKHAITDLAMLKDTIAELFGSREAQKDVFDFLKSSEFISLLLDKADLSKPYPPFSVKANTAAKKPASPADLESSAPSDARQHKSSAIEQIKQAGTATS